MLLPLFIGVRDPFDIDRPSQSYSLLLPTEDVIRALEEAEATGDPENLASLKTMLRQAASTQHIRLDPDGPLMYGFVTYRGFWFQNVSPPRAMPLTTATLRQMLPGPSQQPETSPDPPTPPSTKPRWWPFRRR